jgi:Bacteriophage HK97-gp10, putative tail-component
MIGATLNADALIGQLAALPDRADGALRSAASDLIGRLRDRVDSNLSGGVLNARTGTLRASLAASLDQGGAIAARVTASAPYAAFQEYGFSGSETVRAHLRLQSQAFGRPIRPVEAQVRAFTRQVDHPAHSYLRSALADLSAEIFDGIQTAIAEALS